jgi:hypothetical protein
MLTENWWKKMKIETYRKWETEKHQNKNNDDLNNTANWKTENAKKNQWLN